MFKVNNKNTRTTSTFAVVSIFDFEQVMLAGNVAVCFYRAVLFKVSKICFIIRLSITKCF